MYDDDDVFIKLSALLCGYHTNMYVQISHPVDSSLLLSALRYRLSIIYILALYCPCRSQLQKEDLQVI